MALKLYYDLLSQPARAVYIFMKVNGIDFVDCPVALRKAEHLSENYATVLPFKKVPVIDDGGFTLTESSAMLKYLAIKYKVPEHWYPSDIKKQARIDEYLSWHHLNLRLHSAMYFTVRVIGSKPVDEKTLKRHAAGLEECLDQIEQIFLRNNSRFINGADEITIADLIAATEIEQPIGANHDILANRPILAAYVERVRNLTQPHYNDAHQFIRRVRDGIIKGKL